MLPANGRREPQDGSARYLTVNRGFATAYRKTCESRRERTQIKDRAGLPQRYFLARAYQCSSKGPERIGAAKMYEEINLRRRALNHTCSLPRLSDNKVSISLGWRGSTGEVPMARSDDAQPTVFVIDDDREIRDALETLVRSVGLRAKLFASVQDFLSAGHTDQPGCLVLDVRLPGRSGLDFHDDLVRANVRLPVIFMSGFADVPMSVRALKAGAVEFLTKPVRQQDLLEAIQLAVERDRARRENDAAIAGLRVSYGTLTPRESEVMLLVAAGRLNKQIANDLGLTEATVKVHRGQAMRKMQARSVADLVRMSDKLGLSTETATKTSVKQN